MGTPTLRRLKDPLVSVVMTMYNESKVVTQAIDSLLEQTYRNIEIILVDDCSTDGTLKVISRYAKYRNVRVLALERNGGPGAGRNAGAKVAKGDILVFIDADMVFDKDYIKGLIAPVVAGKAAGSFHDTERVKNIANVWARSFSINRVEDPAETSGIFRSVLRKPFLRSGGFDTSRGYFDDTLSALGPSVRAHAVCYHNNPESLGEIYRHSRWVGRSLIRDAGNRRRFAPAITLSWIGLAVLVALLLSGAILAASVLAVAAAVVLLAFLLVKGVTRAVKDGYPEFLITVPIVWLARLLGYWVGASGELTRRTAGRR